ncbi:hypothetical protein G3T14_20745 [Methylobacterium sp. BTF04]|uniref:diacylglycerol/lipid kinase family protein n=1 Tax=Methylobacterium sp. BTF04 TaxID=2708300 RepID=UPI0013D38E96|nr:diacylglycerol kinase family protein [Methylobacterium sp. BTF04]NEU14527.1 hypothetical protein [Methylobacterium sp. BTF04]
MRFAVVFNIGAGASRQRVPGEVANEITSAFERRSMCAELIVVKGVGVAEAARAAVLSAKNNLVDGVAVGGGDGTVSTVAGVLAGTGIRLGVIPLGTLNHFAKDLAIPIDIEEAVGVIAVGCVREVDVAEVNGKVFVNNSSVGIYPYMVTDRDRQEKGSGRSRWSAMALAAFRMLRRLPLRRLTIFADGRTETCRGAMRDFG